MKVFFQYETSIHFFDESFFLVLHKLAKFHYQAVFTFQLIQ